MYKIHRTAPSRPSPTAADPAVAIRRPTAQLADAGLVVAARRSTPADALLVALVGATTAGFLEESCISARPEVWR